MDVLQRRLALLVAVQPRPGDRGASDELAGRLRHGHLVGGVHLHTHEAECPPGPDHVRALEEVVGIHLQDLAEAEARVAEDDSHLRRFWGLSREVGLVPRGRGIPPSRHALPPGHLRRLPNNADNLGRRRVGGEAVDKALVFQAKSSGETGPAVCQAPPEDGLMGRNGQRLHIHVVVSGADHRSAVLKRTKRKMLMPEYLAQRWLTVIHVDEHRRRHDGDRDGLPQALPRAGSLRPRR